DKPGTLAEVLPAQYRKVAAQAERNLAALSVYFLEQTQYRLAGAEEALAQIEDRLKRTVDGMIGVRQTLAREVLEAYARLFSLIGGLGSGAIRRGAALNEVVETLRAYARKRLRLLVLDNALPIYRGLLNSAPELVREVGFCRARLTELAAAIGGGP